MTDRVVHGNECSNDSEDGRIFDINRERLTAIMDIDIDNGITATCEIVDRNIDRTF